MNNLGHAVADFKRAVAAARPRRICKLINPGRLILPEWYPESGLRPGRDLHIDGSTDNAGSFIGRRSACKHARGCGVSRIYWRPRMKLKRKKIRAFSFEAERRCVQGYLELELSHRCQDENFEISVSGNIIFDFSIFLHIF